MKPLGKSQKSAEIDRLVDVIIRLHIGLRESVFNGLFGK
jgi:hypothetical protein